ncbi:hypothetical protein LTR74_001931 [Friedmanniomyces endolithicus]|nr:hypothetical protein LTR74_001931 [Friedmanniomyces endolithicus]
MSTDNQTFSFETVAVLVAALERGGVKLGMSHYTLMASLAGNRTASSFDHGFRKVKARARELAGQEGSAGAGGTPGPMPTKAKTPGRKRKGKQEDTQDADDEETEGSPSKKSKAKAEVKAEKLEEVDGEGGGDSGSAGDAFT